MGMKKAILEEISNKIAPITWGGDNPNSKYEAFCSKAIFKYENQPPVKYSDRRAEALLEYMDYFKTGVLDIKEIKLLDLQPEPVAQILFFSTITSNGGGAGGNFNNSPGLSGGPIGQ